MQKNCGTYEIEHKNEHKTGLCGLGSRSYEVLHAIRNPRGETLFQNQSSLRINFCNSAPSNEIKAVSTKNTM